MRGIYHLVTDGLTQTTPCRKLHQVHEVVIWQLWPSELARDWLGLELRPLPLLPRTCGR
ncbi:hypothetical protein ACFYM3_16145 [Streptomyces massasporeus]|uniref:Transposase n=1 Tax=Streptomyces massasporeus TaxID=67324 RepID=A0ABW6LEI4_9ACTN